MKIESEAGEGSESEKGNKRPIICADCANLIGVRYKTELANDWKCGAKENIREIGLVTGLPIYHYSTCYDARYDSCPETGQPDPCGKKGEWYIKYIRPIPDYGQLERQEQSRKKITAEDL